MVLGLPDTRPPSMALDEGAVLLPGFVSKEGAHLLRLIEQVATIAPFRQMETPGGGLMSAAMTGCGAAVWVTDRSGYRYTTHDPRSGQPWPALPPLLRSLGEQAARQAGFADFTPNTALLNRYGPGSRMGLHQDRDEGETSQPVVSFSLGRSAVFQWGGARRTDAVRSIVLHHGDAVVWGGPARLFFHGIKPLGHETHPLTGELRYNITLRYVARAAG
ncbi:DNA oxidative demethylase AlkB [Acetobacter sp. TBRC 12305]|uniref:DNA oxidative demethylase AlkB n=1 Tax=Acetobacter garciniae TaxID=2817435 RepID=A0A939HM01_9PROT|nr:DNA oxidative demethylase AlkB [Acetobacter garciniae]MBO1325260.1 DNA oxidative demethylase AlkB [Acetobacter garciniae]MBX0344768.1 DNA oxidative demethylase AlkB [Acetobacter garciniae]